MTKITSIVTRLLSAGLVWLAMAAACSSAGEQAASTEADEVGRIRLDLETVAPSGNIYRLRNAFFSIESIRTGRQEAFLFTEDDPAASVLTAEVDVGEYTVTLEEGWFLERVTNSGGGTGGVGTGGFATAGSVGTGGSAGFSMGGGVSMGGFAAGGRVGTGGFATGGRVGTGGFATGGSPPSSGGGPIIIDPFPSGEVVEAQLLSNAVQFVFVDSFFDAFVSYLFRVGEDVIDFGRGRIHVSIEVDDSAVVPECDEDELLRRATFETSLPALQNFSLRDVFDAMARNEGFTTPAERLYGEVIDSYATIDEARLPDAVHCGDEMTGGGPTLNGFPITCNRQERFQFDNLDLWFPTALVNRLDLAPQNGAHCGQQRIIFANNAQNRMFFIIEAQVPNPAPELGILGCAPLGAFWANLQNIEDSSVRGDLLHQAFLFGTPELSAAGFEPFVKASNFTVGSGTIRTNNFDDFIWTLREFKVAIDGEDMRVVPFPVGEAPNGQLWNDVAPLEQGPACREAFLAAAENLLTDNPAAMSFVVPDECRDAESRNDFSQDYSFELGQGDPQGFQTELAQRFAPFGLSAQDIALRARFAGSCIGCHEEAVGSDLGLGVQAPFSNGFVHVDEFSRENCGSDECFRISPGLRDVFLPHRFGVLQALLGIELPVNDCGSVPGQDGGVEEPPGPGPDPFPVPTPRPVPIPNVPAPPFEPELPSAELDTAELVELDAEARAVFGERTLGGQSAQQTH